MGSPPASGSSEESRSPKNRPLLASLPHSLRGQEQPVGGVASVPTLPGISEQQLEPLISYPWCGCRSRGVAFSWPPYEVPLIFAFDPNAPD